MAVAEELGKGKSESVNRRRGAYLRISVSPTLRFRLLCEDCETDVSIPKIIVPKEHGAWAVLFVPMLVGAGVGGAVTPNFLLLALSALSVFMSYVPVHTILRHYIVAPQQQDKLDQAWFWATAYFLFGVLFMIPLLVQGYLLLLVIGIVGAISFLGNFVFTRRYPKTIPGDLMAVFGLSLSAPCSYYVVRGTLDGHAVVLWLLNFLFFGCSVFYVHMKIAAATSRKTEIQTREKISLGWLNVMYHVGVVAVVVVLAIYERTNSFALITFVPMAVHAIYGTYKLSNRVAFRNLGFILLAQSMIFGVILWRVM